MSTTYTTRNRDMWDLIAYRLTGSTDHIDTIMKANPQYSATFIFSAGVELTIPELNSVGTYEILPPWKRG